MVYALLKKARPVELERASIDFAGIDISNRPTSQLRADIL